MSGNRALFGLTIALSVTFALCGCGKNDSADSSKSSAGAASASTGAPQVSPNESDAREAVLAEGRKQWVKTPDGWTTAKTNGVSVAPDHFLRQIREISISGVES